MAAVAAEVIFWVAFYGRVAAEENFWIAFYDPLFRLLDIKELGFVLVRHSNSTRLRAIPHSRFC